MRQPPPKKYNSPPLIGQPTPSPPQPSLKMKIFWPPPKIQNFQIPTPPLTLGEGGVHTMFLVKVQCKVYLKGINFCRYLISQLEKNYILWVFNFMIWQLQNISRVFSFVISVKIKNKSLIEFQIFYC